ncbi:MAG: sigma-B regulation protein RsbU (phosphoserine phosphatase) [Pseudohongiellaceae bacterium]|jgi:sigma-B regulation protein RsbU (phosphoserine phosphatase)
MPRQFTDAMLPPGVKPDDTLYVADRALNVVHSNAGWTSFAFANKGAELLGEGWNANLLDNMGPQQEIRWRQIYEQLFSGQLQSHRERMSCSSPAEARVFELCITPARDDTGAVAWLVHHAVRIHTDDALGSDLERPSTENAARQRLSLDYREQIVDRQIRMPQFSVAKYLEPLEEIGGDFVWHREHPAGTTDLVHADVMGHGEEAGRIATRIVGILEELSCVELGPVETVAALNHAMLGIVPEGELVFVSGLFFRFDAELQQLFCCSFGHTGPIFSRTGHVAIEIGLPVGLGESEGDWTSVTLDLAEHGRRFLLFSDGITEQFNIDGEMFGVARLQQAFHEHQRLPLDKMLGRIIEDLMKFQQRALVKDDRTVLALEFVGDLPEPCLPSR